MNEPGTTLQARPRFRFYLSTAFIIMLVAGGGLGIYIRFFNLNDPWQQALQKQLDLKCSADYEAEPLRSAAWMLPHSPVYLFVSPEIAEKPTKLKIENQTMRDALARLCKTSNADWDTRNGAILIFPAGKPPPLQRMPHSRDGCDPQTLRKLSRLVTVEMADTPMSEAVNFMGSIINLRVNIDPAVKNPDALVFLCPVNDMRADDMLTWMCFLARTEWKLKKNSVGADEIWIVPQGTK
jgi:hypothetical protein